METKEKSEFINNVYDSYMEKIAEINIKMEREYFKNNKHLEGFTQGLSFKDAFDGIKKQIAQGKADDYEPAFGYLKEALLFSAGHDLMYKTKIKADMYTTPGYKNIVYPLFELESKKAIIACSTNEEAEKKLEPVTDKYRELITLFNTLYCMDYQFPENWKGIIENPDELINIIRENNITNGTIMHAIIDDKCDIMKDIMSAIPQDNLRSEFLKCVEELRSEQKKEKESQPNFNLPLCYFLDHTVEDFILASFEPNTGTGPKM